ncbi:MAG TPA: GNAT family N-acetyltransferase [Gemmatimonadaceae bacterium]|nr:GNAT family N-acetyltransferase [Gemmatimonadaceae bacterium]
MTVSIKRLGPGDEPILDLLAAEDADFDLDGRGDAQRPLDSAAAARFLANPAVLFWVAKADDATVGFLYCLHLPLRTGDGHELLLYEIGVRSAWRRRGTGRALMKEMDRWMLANGVGDVWVCADNQGAVEFYRAFRLAAPDPQPVYMTRDEARHV